MDIYIYRSVPNGVCMSRGFSMDNTSQKGEQGVARSYVIGYILSLIFTFIPYFLVINKYLSGGVLLTTILGIAFLQMVVQLVFFLHLGRGPKPLYNIFFFFATAGVIVITIGASLFIMNNLYRNMSPTEIIHKLAQKENIARVGTMETGACKSYGVNHVVTIKNSNVSPAFSKARLCDTLTFINEQTNDATIIFGSDDPGNQSYGGEYEIGVTTKRPKTITLNEAGSFTFSDRDNQNTVGYFSVDE